MAGQKINELPRIAALSDDARFPVMQGGKTYQATGAQVKAMGGSSDGGSSTGDLTGAVLYDQDQSLTDNQKARARSNMGAVSEADVTNAINTALGNYAAALAELDGVIE